MLELFHKSDKNCYQYDKGKGLCLLERFDLIKLLTSRSIIPCHKHKLEATEATAIHTSSNKQFSKIRPELLISLRIKPDKKFNAFSTKKPSSFSTRHTKFYNMQLDAEKILTETSSSVSSTTCPAPIATCGSCPNPPLTSKVTSIFISGLIFNLDNQINSLRSSISSA